MHGIIDRIGTENVYLSVRTGVPALLKRKPGSTWGVVEMVLRTSPGSNLLGVEPDITSVAMLARGDAIVSEAMRQKETYWPGGYATYTGTIHADLDLETNSDRAPFGHPGGAGASHVGVPERSGLMLGGFAPTLVVFLFDFWRVRHRNRS